MNSVEPEWTDTEQGQREGSQPQTDLKVESPASLPEIKRTEDERIASAPVAGEVHEVEVSAQPYPAEVSYSCLLIPRFHDHHLAGDITDDLAVWIKEICISYGWRLNAILVRPGYLQWVLTVPLTENPARVMRLVRQHTSVKIIEDYPRFKRQNVSGDFWAPGYYVAPGDQLLSLETVSSFTLATRKQQGIF
jgi:REP element-mobilizing transposase RayT